MEKGFKIQIFPNKEQQILMFKSFGCARFAYNWALAKEKENYKNGGKFIPDKQLRKEFTQLKKQNEYKWLNEISCNVTKQAIKDCCKAYKNFFKGINKYPKFKSKKKSKFSFYNDTFKIKFTDKKVMLETIGWMNIAERNKIPTNCKYLNPRISFDGIRFWLSIGCVVEDVADMLPKTEPIGIDMGIKTLMVCSNKMEFKRVNTKKERKKLKRLQKKASRLYEKMLKTKISKSSNLLKLEKMILKQHQKISNIRINNIHQATSKLIKLNPSHIVVEDLNIKGMMKNKYLSEKIVDCSFHEIRRQLEYKCKWNNIKLIVANKWYASSKICSNCGNKKDKLSLSERIYTCECCGKIIDRDFNASLNLRNLAYN
ncbi:transposase, IS605 OrfB family (plasmid) [Clostridium botulinum]|uniref:RNA-guided endonuclease InsQ/TnpB family protein n=4 Tax=Clostridium botulinum TaxID=1491 RepID=UPI0004635A96|nr:RNA-guided endonuclease TnpB family protein [Clostridium botulinum]APR02442.1 transposase, IS605 OrfB family [Clostridium botulinum]AUN01599.1 transposase [Clostridium botulinum]MBN3367146.1 transposase [Clostridium botulinum]MBN3376403.1 transposase [Clostridium botulinum]MBN3384321.1 transposase [Clostridium botulinum]